MAFTAKDVAKLREITGAGMMDCKKALTHTDGDMDKATEYLREIGVNIAVKKCSRIASEGAVSAYTSESGNVGVLVEINCESDFVSKGDGFQQMAKSLAAHVAKTNPANVEEFLNSAYEKGTVNDAITNAIAKIGEKISFRRFVRQSIDNGREEAYIHMGGKIGVLLEVETSVNLNSNSEFVTMCHDIAMHIAAFAPKYLYDEEVPSEEIEHEKEILKAQALNDPKNAKKPEMVIAKMIEGRIGKFFKEVCLIDQEFAKDNSITIRQLVDGVAKKLGAQIKLKKFTRFVMGEGLEKKTENFAEEVAKMI